MTAAIEAAERSRGYLTRYLSRPGCHPCDRSEAGHQLSIVNDKIEKLKSSYKLLINA